MVLNWVFQRPTILWDASSISSFYPSPMDPMGIGIPPGSLTARPLKIGLPKRKGLSSNHPFSGAMLNFGGVSSSKSSDETPKKWRFDSNKVSFSILFTNMFAVVGGVTPQKPSKHFHQSFIPYLGSYLQVSRFPSFFPNQEVEQSQHVNVSRCYFCMLLTHMGIVLSSPAPPPKKKNMRIQSFLMTCSI